MAAGLRQRLAGREDTRPGHQPRGHGLRQAPVGAAGIAHRGEAAVEHAFHDRQRADRNQYVGLHRVQAQVGQRGQHVHMAVDQAGHHGLATRIDALCVGRIDARADRDDALALDENIMAAQQLAHAGVEHIAAVEEDLRNLGHISVVAGKRVRGQSVCRPG